MFISRYEDLESKPRHSIAVVARKTGLSQHLLRAWEGRYGAVRPHRTPTGRRLYTDQDLQRLQLLRKLTDADHRIGNIANLPLGDLRDLARDELVAPWAPPAEATELLEQALAAIAGLDARALEQTLRQASVQLSRPELRELLLQPLLAQIGEKWHDGTLRIAHEHLATAVIRSFISGLNTVYGPHSNGPVLAVATPAGQLHELGAMLAASQAQEEGWDVLYLGPNLPAEEIAAAALARGSQAVLLSLVYPAGDPGIAAQMRLLRQLLGPEIPLVAGGQAAESYAAVLEEIEALVPGDFADLRRFLAEISRS